MTILSESPLVNQQARHDFERARRRAFLGEVAGWLQRRPHAALAYAEVERHLPIVGQIYRGVQPISLAAIQGSVDRHHDFDRDFLPTQNFTRARWESVDRANLTGVDLPAIQVYKVGSTYFVKDGNHRVSVAQQSGMDYIDAEVIEIQTEVPLPPGADPGDLLRLGEHGRFFAATQLDRLRPANGIAVTDLGSYDRLLDHIRGHRWFLGLTYHRPFGWTEAVESWYDTVYAPLVALIRRHAIMDAFPGRTEADLYLWIVEHNYYLSLQRGDAVDAATALESFRRHHLGRARKLLAAVRRRSSRARQAIRAFLRLPPPPAVAPAPGD